MKNQNGFSITELLISIFLTSIIVLVLIEFYINCKRQYLKIQHELNMTFDVNWVGDLLSDSIRRAGFTPCLGINQLKITDTRNSQRVITSISVEKAPFQSISISRMSEDFIQFNKLNNETELIVPQSVFKSQRPILIADCEHAEIHQILGIDKLAKGYRIRLNRPLIYSYPSITYIGEWFEEKWFIKIDENKNSTLHYKLFQSEELTPLIHSLEINRRMVHHKQWIEVKMGLDDDKSHQLMVAVRGS